MHEVTENVVTLLGVQMVGFGGPLSRRMVQACGAPGAPAGFYVVEVGD
jgi:hypothetical protein